MNHITYRNEALDAIARKVISLCDPSLLDVPAPIPIETIIEKIYGLTIEFQYIRNNGRILGETVFEDCVVPIYNRRTGDGYTLELFRAGTIIIDASLINCRSDGRYVYTCAHELAHWVIVDEETAPVVVNIFQWKSEGMGNKTICRRLDELGITSPSVRLQELYYKNGQDHFKSSVWQPGAIQKILSRKVYLGHLEQGRTYQARCENSPKKQKLPQSKWCLVENTHEPIISQELWEAANKVVAERRAANDCTPKYAHPENILSGFLVCGVCGSKMTRFSTKSKGKHYYYYECRLSRQHNEIQRFPRLRDKYLKDVVFDLVKKQLAFASDSFSSDEVARVETEYAFVDVLFGRQREGNRCDAWPAKVYHQLPQKQIVEIITSRNGEDVS